MTVSIVGIATSIKIKKTFNSKINSQWLDSLFLQFATVKWLPICRLAVLIVWNKINELNDSDSGPVLIVKIVYFHNDDSHCQ